MIATSAIWSFTTAGTAGPPPAPSTPDARGRRDRRRAPRRRSAGPPAPPARPSTWRSARPIRRRRSRPDSTTPSFTPGTLAAEHHVLLAGDGGVERRQHAGPDLVVHDRGRRRRRRRRSSSTRTMSPAAGLHGAWSTASDATAAAGIKLSNPDAGAAALTAPLASPTHYFDAPFQTRSAAHGTASGCACTPSATPSSTTRSSCSSPTARTRAASAIYRIGTDRRRCSSIWPPTPARPACRAGAGSATPTG